MMTRTHLPRPQLTPSKNSKLQETLDAHLEAQACEHRSYWQQRCLTAYKKWCEREDYVIWDDVDGGIPQHRSGADRAII